MSRQLFVRRALESLSDDVDNVDERCADAADDVDNELVDDVDIDDDNDNDDVRDDLSDGDNDANVVDCREQVDDDDDDERQRRNKRPNVGRRQRFVIVSTIVFV